MQQYFVKEHIVLDQPIQMDDEAFHHISHVLRMKENDIIRLCDEKQLCYARLHFENGAVYALPYERIEDKTKTAVPDIPKKPGSPPAPYSPGRSSFPPLR